MNYGCIYIIKNKINDKVYIGQTLQGVEERFKQHMKPSNSKRNYKIYRAISKYGSENFYYEILEDNVSEDEINGREVYWIEKYDSFKNGYNSNTGGDGRSIYKDIDVQYLISELKKGKQVKELVQEFGVCKETIVRTLNRNGIKNAQSIQNTKIALGKAQKSIDRDLVKQLRLEGKTTVEISKIINCNSKTVRRILSELDIEIDRPRYDYTDIFNDDIIKDKLNNMKVKDILKKYNISYGYYYIIWKEYRSQNANSNDYPDRE